jgi:hypothetical protein
VHATRLGAIDEIRGEGRLLAGRDQRLLQVDDDPRQDLSGEARDVAVMIAFDDLVDPAMQLDVLQREVLRKDAGIADTFERRDHVERRSERLRVAVKSERNAEDENGERALHEGI